MFGRVVEVRRLRPSDSFWTRQVAASDLTDVTTEALIASSVCSITEPDGRTSDLRPPRTGAELSVRLNLLEAEGMSAAMAAYARLVGAQVLPAGKTVPDGADDGAPPNGDESAGIAEPRRKSGRRGRQPTAQAPE